MGENFNQINDTSGVSAIDNSSNLKGVFTKVDKLGNLWDKGEIDACLIRLFQVLLMFLNRDKFIVLHLKKHTHRIGM